MQSPTSDGAVKKPFRRIQRFGGKWKLDWRVVEQDERELNNYH